MSRWAPGFDTAFSRVSRPWCRARYNEGYRVGVQNLWTGGYGNNDRIREVAAPNLSDFLEEGFLIAGYANANPWYPPANCLDEIILNAGGMWDSLRIVAEDVEIPGVVEGDIRDLCDALESQGKRVPFYTAAWFFKDFLGNPQWPWLREHKIWEAFYDGDPDIDFLNRRFGPWELDDVIGEQYLGTTLIDGVDVDLNVFNLDFWEGEERMNAADKAYIFMASISQGEQKLARGSADTVFIVTPSGKRPFPVSGDAGPKAFNDVGFRWVDVHNLEDAVLAAIPNAP